MRLISAGSSSRASGYCCAVDFARVWAKLGSALRRCGDYSLRPASTPQAGLAVEYATSVWPRLLAGLVISAGFGATRLVATHLLGVVEARSITTALTRRVGRR